MSSSVTVEHDNHMKERKHFRMSLTRQNESDDDF